MKKYKKIPILIISLVFLSSCGKGCIEANDFGDSGDYDIFTVFANSSNCSWNSDAQVSDNTNEYIKSCLTNTKASSVSAMNRNGSFDIGLVEHITSVSGKNGKDIGDLICSAFDSAVVNNNAFVYTSNYETVGLGEKNTIFSMCLDHCQNLCASNASQDESLWEKANLKTSSSSLGIDIGNNTTIKIKATGTVALSEENAGAEMNFKRKSMDERAENASLPANAKINLSLILSKNINSTPPVSVDVRNYGETAERIYLKFGEINSELLLDKSKLVSCPKFKDQLTSFQEPRYFSINCAYSKVNTNDYFTEKYCTTDYSKVLSSCGMTTDDYKNAFIAKLNAYHNFKKTNADIFSDNFYYYASPALDYIRYDIDKESLIIDENSPFNIEKVLTVNGFALNVELSGGSKFLDGYFWATGNEFSFSVNKPVKLAIKQFSNGGTCNYIVEEKKNNNLEAKFPVDDNKYFSYSSGSVKKWQVLKKTNNILPDNEIVFNPFSAGDYKNEVVLAIRAMDNADVCNKVLIKLIQLKDYEATESGFMFLNINNSGNIFNNREIKYTLLNRGALTVPMSTLNGITLEDRYSNFFEFSEDRYTIKNETVKMVVDNEIENNVDVGDINSIYDDKAIFVRKGQIIRFDYSNWYSLDGLTNITMTDGWTYTTDDNSSYGVPFGLGLMSSYKKNSAFICIGGGKKIINVSEQCNRNGGNVSVIQASANTTAEKCFIQEDAYCIATREEQMNLKNFNFGRDGGCTIDQQVDQTFFDGIIELKTFAADVYNIYQNTDNSKLTCSNFKTLVSNLYDKTKSCVYYLANSQDKYEVFLPNLTKNTTGDGSGSENTYYTENTYSLTDGTILKNVFPATKPTNTVKILTPAQDGQIDIIAKAFNLKLKNYTKTVSKDGDKTTINEISIYDTFFYYYRKDLCVFDQATQGCLVDGFPFCYNLNNYKGSISNFIKNTLENNETDLLLTQQFGNLITKDREENFGASLVSSFVGKEGNISNFSYSGVDTADNVILVPKDQIVLDKNSYVSMFYMNNFSTARGTTSYAQMKNSLKSVILSSQYIKILTSSLQNFRNGERLAVFLGRNAASYKSEVPTSITNGFSSSDILHIVQYTKNNGSLELADSTSYTFREDGSLINKNTLSSSLMTADSYFSSYTSGTKTNLFFKIMDTDANSGNNSGSYSITINTIQTDDGNTWLSNAFSGFFNKVLEFMDGQKIKLQFDNNNSIIKCEDSVLDVDINKEFCTTYNPEDTSKNGEICTKGSSYCYRNCKNMDRTAIIENKCKSVHDGNGFLKNVFLKILTNTLFNFIIKISFILMLTFYGFNFFLGKSKFTYTEMLNKIIRMCFIYFMLSESGWDFFNNYFVGFFKQGIDSLLFTIASAFETGLDSPIIQAVETGNFSDKMVLFSSGFRNIEILFSNQILYKLTGLAFSSIFGLIYLYLMFTTLLSYVVAVLTSLIIYLNSQIYMSFVMSLFPVVLLFMVFDKTKKSLDNWFNMIVGFAFQQIFLILTISFFNNLMYNLIKSVFAYRVCWLPIFNLKISGLTLFILSWWKIPNVGLTAAADTGLIGGPSFYNIMFFYVNGVLMGKFITGMTELGNSIAGGSKSVTGGMAGFASGGLSAMKGAVESGAKTIGKGVYSRAAGAVGLDVDGEKRKKADEARKKRNESRKEVSSSSNSSADKRISDYKRSENFKNDMKSKPGYNTADNKTKKQMEEEHLSKKRNEYQHEDGVKAALENDTMLSRLGVSKDDVAAMSGEQKKNLYEKMEATLENDGLIKPISKEEKHSVDINQEERKKIDEGNNEGGKKENKEDRDRGNNNKKEEEAPRNEKKDEQPQEQQKDKPVESEPKPEAPAPDMPPPDAPTL